MCWWDNLPFLAKGLKNNCLRGIILILLVRESIFVGWGFSFPIVLVPGYKLSLCHPPIKLDLLGFPGIGVFACGLRDHVITRFASLSIISSRGFRLNPFGHIINSKNDIKDYEWRRRKWTHKINTPNIKISLTRKFLKGIWFLWVILLVLWHFSHDLQKWYASLKIEGQ